MAALHKLGHAGEDVDVFGDDDDGGLQVVTQKQDAAAVGGGRLQRKPGHAQLGVALRGGDGPVKVALLLAETAVHVLVGRAVQDEREGKGICDGGICDVVVTAG